MPKPPITPTGGASERITTRIARGDRASLDAAARRRGLTLSQYVRSVLLDAVEADAQEATKAS